ncbi:MAG: hypothetical protein ACOZNI_27115 [Myxococcota bacterium]
MTWAFDPLFFERLVLPDLWGAGTGDVVVLADRARVDESTERWVGQVRHLGRRYALSTARDVGAFHPKVLVRVGPRGAIVWAGSGNLTWGGWGANQEVAACWRVGPGMADTGAWLRALLTDAAAWCGDVAARELIVRLGDRSWLADANNEGLDRARVLWSRAGTALGPALSHRWRGRRFTDLWMLTGSTDVGGAMLEWAHRAFGVERAVVAVDPAHADFSPERLASLPFLVRLVVPRAERLLHAKCLLLHGPDGDALVMGSANCSAAAWLLPPENGGNVEAVVVYDHVDAEAVAVMRELRSASALSPGDVLHAGSRQQRREPGARTFRLASLRINPSLGRVEVELDPPAPPNTAVVLEVSSREILLQRVTEREWVGPLPDFELHPSTFGRLRVEAGGRTDRTGWRWFDDVQQLHRGARAHPIGVSLSRLGRVRTPDEQRALLDELHLAAVSIFDEPSAFADPSRTRTALDEHPPPVLTPEVDAPRLDPSELVVRLREMTANAVTACPLGAVGGGLPITGVMLALFGKAEEDGEGVTGLEGDEDSVGLGVPEPTGDDGGDGGDGGALAPSDPTPRERPPEALRKRLADELGQFLKRLGETRFADSCTAAQLVQAVSFPLAVVLIGLPGGWTDAEGGRSLVANVLDHLFRRKLRPGDPPGLLAAVSARYAARGDSHVFERALGDGTLWITLTSAITRVSWVGPGAAIQRSLALREVYRSRELIASADAGRLAPLVARLPDPALVVGLLEEAPRVSSLLDDVEARLGVGFERRVARQVTSRGAWASGDAMWGPTAGWAIALHEAGMQMGTPVRAYLPRTATEVKIRPDTRYANVRLACADDPDLARAVGELAWPL